MSGKVKVLYAHPDRKQRNRYRRLLSSVGYRVQVVGDGLGCLESFRECPPDILILHPALLWGGPLGVLAVLEEEGRLEDADVVFTQDILTGKRLELMLQMCDRDSRLFDVGA